VPRKNRSPYLWKLTVITLQNIKEKHKNLKHFEDTQALPHYNRTPTKINAKGMET